MPSDPVLKLSLQSANPVNKDLTWEDPSICKSPSAFAEVLTRLLFVDAGEFANLSGVIRSASRPSSADTGKIWAKTSSPVGVGVYSGGQWKVVYQYAVNTPILWSLSNGSVPSYMSPMSESAIDDAGLQEPNDGTKWTWVIFSPPTYS